MSAADEANPRAEALQAELDEVKRREASFRVKMIHEFLDRGERNTYLHTLRQERADLVKRGQEASSDIEALTRKLEALTCALESEARKSAALQGDLTSLRADFATVRGSLSWKLAAPLRAIGRMFSPDPPPAPAGAPAPAPAAPARPDGAPFTYYLHTSPFRIYRGTAFTLRGWAWPEDGRSVTGVRANVDGRLFPGRLGIEEPEVIARYGPQAANPLPGFEVTFETPPGRHVLGLEAELAGAEWRTIVCTTIWCEPDPA
jgi:hypothetical protein